MAANEQRINCKSGRQPEVCDENEENKEKMTTRQKKFLMIGRSSYEC